MSYLSRLTYGEAISQGAYSSIIKWSKIGYVPIPATTETDVWSYGGTTATIPLPAAAATMKVQSNNAQDGGTSLYSGTSTGGTTTSIIDTGKDFTTPTSVAVGDCVILEKAGTTPEWGYVTALVGTHELTIGNGFSKGGTGTGRTYDVVDQSATTGAQAILISYLDSSYASKSEIVLPTAGTPGYTTTTGQILRVNSFRIIAVGSTGKCVGAMALMDSAASPTIVYTYITAGYTKARNSVYTVPAGQTLWVSDWNVGFAAQTSGKQETCRIYTRAGQYASEAGIMFKTQPTQGLNVWYPYTEVVDSNGFRQLAFEEPTKILQKVDVKVSAYASATGQVCSVLRGYLTTP